MLDCPAALIADDGQTVVALGDLKDQEDENGRTSCDDRALLVFGASGQRLYKGAADGLTRLVGLLPHPSGFVVQGDDRVEARGFDGVSLGRLPLSGQESVALSPDRTMILVASEKRGTTAAMYQLVAR